MTGAAEGLRYVAGHVNKWTKIAAGAAAVMVIGAAAWCGWASKEPRYKGHTVHCYVNILGSDARDSGVAGEKREALRYFGTNIVPCLHAALRARDTWDRRALVWLANHAPWLRLWAVPADSSHIAGLQTYTYALWVDSLGNMRAACASDVQDLLSDPDPIVRFQARGLLGAINKKSSAVP